MSKLIFSGDLYLRCIWSKKKGFYFNIIFIILIFIFIIIIFRFSQKGYDKNDTDSDTGFRNLVTSRGHSFWNNQPTRFLRKIHFRQMTNLEKFIGFFRRRCCKMRNFGLKISVNKFPFYKHVFFFAIKFAFGTGSDCSLKTNRSVREMLLFGVRTTCGEHLLFGVRWTLVEGPFCYSLCHSLFCYSLAGWTMNN